MANMAIQASYVAQKSFRFRISDAGEPYRK